ncbi:MAG: sulfotransferase [Proteobacteria bacterium]|jgi:tetratricopeptide (TPR) repeat protein|nr:sulfotransferase [Pseudomonadota bacterium]
MKIKNKKLTLSPEAVQNISNLGISLAQAGRLDEAIIKFREIIKINPKDFLTRNNMGNAVLEKGEISLAISNYKKALAIKPDYDEAFVNMSTALMRAGRRQESIASLEKAIKIRPDNTEAIRGLSILKKYQKGDPQINEMLNLINRKGLLSLQKMHLSFAIGKAYEDIGMYGESFSFYLEGNRLRKLELNYNIQTDRSYFRKTKSRWSEFDGLGSELKNINSKKSKQPIFIIGMPRSGTTIVEQLLSNHPNICGAGELTFLNKAIVTANLNDTQVNAKKIESVRVDYMKAISGLKYSEKYIVDKMPQNFLYIGYIVNAFPEAKIIMLERDARATCWSNFKHYFAKKSLGYSYDLMDISEYYKLYVDLMNFWNNKYPGYIYKLNYERFVENVEQESQKLFEYLGVGWDRKFLELDKNTRLVSTASALQVRKNIYKGSSDDWKRYAFFLNSMTDSLKEF